MYYIFESILLYGYFNFIIFVFGLIIGYYLLKFDFSHNKSPIFIVISGLGIGYSVFFLLEYVFITIWTLNIFTGSLFYLICDICGISFTIYNEIKNKGKTSPDISFKVIILAYFESLYHNGMQYFKKKRITLLYFLCLYSLFICMYLVFYWPFINFTSAHLSSDPYTWEGIIYYLLRTQKVNYSRLEAYPAGVILFVSSILVIVPEIGLREIHYFNKIFPMLILFTILAIFILICFEFFTRKRSMIIISVLAILMQAYFIYRNFMLLPTTIVTLLLLFSIYFVAHYEEFRKALGIIFGAIFLNHPLYGVIITSFYILASFVFDIFLYTKGSKEELRENQAFIIRLNQWIKDILPCIWEILFCLLIFVINLSIFYTWKFYTNYLYYFTDLITGTHPTDTINDFSNNSILLSILSILNAPTPLELPYSMISDEILGSILVYFLIFWIGFPLHRFFDIKSYRLMVFLKIIVASLLLIFYLDWIITSLGFQDTFLNLIINSSFYKNYQYRTQEIITFPKLLLITFGLIYIIEFIEKWANNLYSKYISKKKKHDPLKQNAQIDPRIVITAFFICSMIIVRPLFFSNINLAQNSVLDAYYFDDNMNTFALEFRESETELIRDTPNLKPTIFYESNDTRPLILLQSFFWFDHNLTMINSSVVTTLQAVLKIINENASIGDYCVFSNSSLWFDYFKTNYVDFGTLSYSNAEIIVIRKE